MNTRSVPWAMGRGAGGWLDAGGVDWRCKQVGWGAHVWPGGRNSTRDVRGGRGRANSALMGLGKAEGCAGGDGGLWWAPAAGLGIRCDRGLGWGGARGRGAVGASGRSRRPQLAAAVAGAAGGLDQVPTSQPCRALVPPRNLFRVRVGLPPDGRLDRAGAALALLAAAGRGAGKVVWSGGTRGWSHQEWAVCMVAGCALWLQVAAHGLGGKVTGSGWPRQWMDDALTSSRGYRPHLCLVTEGCVWTCTPTGEKGWGPRTIWVGL